MKAKYLIFFILLATVKTFSHPNERDSLLAIVNDQAGEEKVLNLIQIARGYFVEQDTLSLRFSKEAIELPKSMGYRLGVGQAKLFHALGMPEIMPDSALKYYLASSEILDELAHPWAHFGYKNAADIYINWGWYPEALNLMHKILDINKRSGDTLLMVESLSTLGHLHYSLREYTEADHWQREALQILGELYDPVRKGLIYGRIGIGFDEQGMYDSALYYNYLALAQFEKAEATDYIAQWLSNVANTHIQKGEYAEAGKTLNQAFTYDMHPDRKAIIFNNLGKVYLETGKFELAERALDSAAWYAKRFHYLRFLSETYYRRHELRLRQGRTTEALDLFKHYANLKDSLWDVSKTEQLAMMRAKFEIESKENALLLEKAERDRMEHEKNRAELSALRAQRWLLGTGVFVLLLGMHIYLVMQRTRRKAENEKNLAIIREQEKGLEAIIQAQEDERQRVAKDLHDGVGQQVSALSLNFQVLGQKISACNDGLIEDVEKIKRLIRETGNDVRNVSHQMMPRALTDFGLVDALEDLLDKCFENSNINHIFSHNGLEERLPRHIEIALYRITQELANNIIKHAKASEVVVAIERTGSLCNLSVKDDGIGMQKKSRDGLGINNIRGRANALKGKLNIRSRKGKGTKVDVAVEIKPT